jgi:hypothetical protein
MAKFHQVAAIREARSIPNGGDQARAYAVQDFSRAAARSRSNAARIAELVAGLFPQCIREQT